MTNMSQTFDELNALWQAEVDALNRSVQESQRMIESLLEGQRAKVKVWVVVSDGHNLSEPAVNVCATEARALQLVNEMWEIWQQDYMTTTTQSGLKMLLDLPCPTPFHQGDAFAFEDSEVDYENNEWHYVYEVEIDNG